MTPRQKEIEIIDNYLYLLVKEAIDLKNIEIADFLLKRRKELGEEFTMINEMIKQLKDESK